MTEHRELAIRVVHHPDHEVPQLDEDDTPMLQYSPVHGASARVGCCTTWSLTVTA